jgi:hypothetical protein
MWFYFSFKVTVKGWGNSKGNIGENYDGRKKNKRNMELLI